MSASPADWLMAQYANRRVPLTGWLLDLYAHPREGITLWLLGEDGRRYRLRQQFPVTFYAAGDAPRLRALWHYLKSQPVPIRLYRTERRDIFQDKPIILLAIEVSQPAAQPALFRRVAKAFPELTYYDADLPLALRHAAIHYTFPLARCKITATVDGWIESIHTLDSPWDLDPPRPPLRIMRITPETSPVLKSPAHIRLRCERRSYRFTLEPARALLVNLRAVLKRHDPDLLLTTWGDTWLLPYLLELSKRHNIPLPLNRDPEHGVAYRPERSYFSYGQVIYRGQQVHLFGRIHIDRHNVMFFDDYALEGIFENARVTGLPLQTSARTSPGTGVSSMQMVTALRQGILVPWHKQQAEKPKTALKMFYADQGGLVYQPIIGLHKDVAGIDFISMYPGIMVHFNISPETVEGRSHSISELLPLREKRGDRQLGLVPLTLGPLLEKRVAIKTRLATLPCWDPRRKLDKARSAAHKWLLVTCFGYLGYKNARFGRIEAHEAVTAYGREALLRAKEAAEDMGFTVLQMYVDGLWVKKPGARQASDFQPLLDEVARRTGLPIALDGLYRWVAFLPSRSDPRVPVPNRYFGAMRDGSLKVRGIEARRHDTPPFVKEAQLRILELLAACDAGQPEPCIEKALTLLRRKLDDLRCLRVPLQSLVVGQTLSRELDEYRIPSPPARAAAQLQAAGVQPRAGQRVHFLYTRGTPGVRAWELAEPVNPKTVDVGYYRELMLRAALTVLEPFGMTEAVLQQRIHNCSQTTAACLLPAGRVGNYTLRGVGA